MVVLDVVDSLVVSFEREVGGSSSERPDLDGVVETGGGEGVGVFWVDGERPVGRKSGKR